MPIHRHEGVADGRILHKGNVLGTGPWWGDALQPVRYTGGAKP